MLKKEVTTEELHEANTQTIEPLIKQIEKLHEELKDEKMVSSSLIKQKQATTDARDKDIKDHEEVGVQFNYLILQSGMHVFTGIVVMMCLYCFRFDRL